PVEMLASGRAGERAVAVGGDPAVVGQDPVAPAGGAAGEADHRGRTGSTGLAEGGPVAEADDLAGAAGRPGRSDRGGHHRPPARAGEDQRGEGHPAPTRPSVAAVVTVMWGRGRE